MSNMRLFASTAVARGSRFLHSWKMLRSSTGPPSPKLRRASCIARPWRAAQDGGASRDRTGDLKLAKLALSQLSYGPITICEVRECSRMFAMTSRSDAAVVGREGVEPSTSRLSGVRSNHLSYRPPYPFSLRRRRSHPRAWLSSHKLGRAFALAALTGRKASSG